METRKITIIATREQKKYVIDSAAETLEELKQDLDKVGINYDDMTFMEGLTRTEILSDDSLLPKDVSRTDRETGEQYTTNELVFMLTNTEKKIRSGMDRKECYDFIKANCLQDLVKETFGKNFTMVCTEALEKFVEDSIRYQEMEPKGVEENDSEQVDRKARKAIVDLCDALEEYDTCGFYEVCDKIRNEFSTASSYGEEGEKSPYSDEEIDEMFIGLK